MWTENSTFKHDLDAIVSNSAINWSLLDGKNLYITGGTGLIGYTLVSALAYAAINKKLNIGIYLLVRDLERSQNKFSAILKEYKNISFVVGTVEEAPKPDARIDYIIHGAAPTASSFFVENPVETIKASVLGTMGLLEIAKENKSEGFCYLSTMEVYGSPSIETPLKETDLGYMDSMFVRNSYPGSKRLCETMCASYASEYGIRTMTVRLAQTFGPGVKKDDGRVFADFARRVVSDEDIVMFTAGTSKRCYLYTMDAVAAILTVLLNGEAGNAYNAGNSETYCSIIEMAHMIAKDVAGDKIKVVQELNSDIAKRFAPPHFYNLDTSKLEALGWKPTKNLTEMYQVLCEEFRKE